MEFNLKKFRKENQLTQIDLAKALKVSQQTILRWEKGYNTPCPQTITKIKNIINEGANTQPYYNPEYSGIWLGYIYINYQNSNTKNNSWEKIPALMKLNFLHSNVQGLFYTYEIDTMNKYSLICNNIKGKSVTPIKYAFHYNRTENTKTNTSGASTLFYTSEKTLRGSFSHFCNFKSDYIHGALVIRKINYNDENIFTVSELTKNYLEVITASSNFTAESLKLNSNTKEMLELFLDLINL